MSRIEREKQTVEMMVRFYCKCHHGTGDELCSQCAALLKYACARLDHCPKGDQKSSCRKCDIHCYSPENRARIREVMRYVGPRMLFYHPVAAIRHLLSELK